MVFSGTYLEHVGFAKLLCHVKINA